MTTTINTTVTTIPEFKLNKLDKGFYTFLGDRYLLNKDRNGRYYLQVKIEETEYVSKWRVVYNDEHIKKFSFVNFFEARRYVKDHWALLHEHYETIRAEVMG